MSQRLGFSALPPELLLNVAWFLSSRDLSSCSRLNRQLHWRLFYYLFDRAIEEKSAVCRIGAEKRFVDLFLYAVKHDSKNIAQYLSDSTAGVDLNGSIPTYNFRAACKGDIWDPHLSLPRNFTFLHFALLADAPRVAVYLMKNGADISQEVEEYPDLTPLYMTLPRSLASNQTGLASALRIACSYALPRTAGFLLASGANPNTTSAYGMAAAHIAVMRRRPWREFSHVGYVLSLGGQDDSRWESLILETVSRLLEFGADVHLQSRASRTHACKPSCWRSIDCAHQGQTALHMASASGILAIVSRLLDAGADPNMPDAQGYTPLYSALVQGHEVAARWLLRRCGSSLNPIVYTPEQTTALHVACRFSFSEMVYELLAQGADANVPDSKGRTPLHDVLKWGHSEREKDLVHTLHYLAEFGADFDEPAHCPTLRRLAETHPSNHVRDMFSTSREKRRVRPATLNRSSGSTK